MTYVPRVPCSVPAYHVLASATGLRHGLHHRHGAANLVSSVPFVYLPVPFHTTVPRVGRRVQCQSLSNYSLAAGGHALYTHDAVVIHSPLQSTACGCSTFPSRGSDGTRGSQRVGSESNLATACPAWPRWEVGTGHEGATRDFCPSSLAPWLLGRPSSSP